MKTVCLITARLKSSRLPGKALLPIAGRPLIGRLVDQLRYISQATETVVCTSNVALDDKLVAFAEKEQISCFRGDPDDVLMRLNQAAETFAADVILSTTADNPFIDPHYLAELGKKLVADKLDFCQTKNLPIGAYGFAVSASALKRACFIKSDLDTEHWLGYFTQSGAFKCGALEVGGNDGSWPELRLTVDTPEDYRLACRIATALGDAPIRIGDIIEWCRQHPEAVALNSEVQQQSAPELHFNFDDEPQSEIGHTD